MTGYTHNMSAFCGLVYQPVAGGVRLPVEFPTTGRIRCHQVLGGLMNDY